MNIHEIAVISGDGVGKEIVPATLKVLDRIAELHGGIKFRFEQLSLYTVLHLIL